MIIKEITIKRPSYVKLAKTKDLANNVAPKTIGSK